MTQGSVGEPQARGVLSESGERTRPRVLVMAASPSRTFPLQKIAARRRNEHARRVRSPEGRENDVVRTCRARIIRAVLTPNKSTAQPFHDGPITTGLFEALDFRLVRLDEGRDL